MIGPPPTGGRLMMRFPSSDSETGLGEMGNAGDVSKVEGQLGVCTPKPGMISLAFGSAIVTVSGLVSSDGTRVKLVLAGESAATILAPAASPKRFRLMFLQERCDGGLQG